MLNFEGKIAPEHMEAMDKAYMDCSRAFMDTYGTGDFVEQHVVVTYNARLKTTAGRVGWKPGIQAWRIELNPKYHKEFGLERMMGTFRHELAHIADWVQYKNRGHSNTFKRLCCLFEGTMNTQFARGEHADAGTDQYLQAPERLKYSCPKCSFETHRKKRLTKKMASKGVCPYCRTPASKFTVEHLM